MNGKTLKPLAQRLHELQEGQRLYLCKNSI